MTLPELFPWRMAHLKKTKNFPFRYHQYQVEVTEQFDGRVEEAEVQCDFQLDLLAEDQEVVVAKGVEAVMHPGLVQQALVAMEVEEVMAKKAQQHHSLAREEEVVAAVEVLLKAHLLILSIRMMQRCLMKQQVKS